MLTILFRVIPLDRDDDPVYMIQKIRIPAVEEDAKGTGQFYGVFTLGEGKYHVDWLMRDNAERVCAAFWNLEPKLAPKEIPMRAWIPPAPVQPLRPIFAAAPPVLREPQQNLLRVGIIVNFVPRDPASAALDAQDVEDTIAILRRIGSDPHIGTYSVVACSLETQQVVYRQDNDSRIDIPALGESLKSLKLGTVDAKQLGSKNGPAEFAASLFNDQRNDGSRDALIVLGRKAGWEDGMSNKILESIENVGGPVFYLSYETKAQQSQWRDPFGAIVKHLRGFEYSISRPRDLFIAWSDVVSRAMRAKSFAPTLSEGGGGR